MKFLKLFEERKCPTEPYPESVQSKGYMSYFTLEEEEIELFDIVSVDSEWIGIVKNFENLFVIVEDVKGDRWEIEPSRIEILIKFED